MNGNPAPSDSKVQAISTMREICVQREWQPTAVFLPGESHGEKTLAGYSPRGCKESDMTEKLTHNNTDQGVGAKSGNVIWI